MDAVTAIRAFESARHDLQRLGNERRIGSTRVLHGIQSAIRNFGQGVEGMWALTSRQPDAVPQQAAHALLIDLKNLAVFEGAARVARQRSGSMAIPREQNHNLRTAYQDAGLDGKLLLLPGKKHGWQRPTDEEQEAVLGFLEKHLRMIETPRRET